MSTTESFPRIESPEAFRMRAERVSLTTPDGARVSASLFHPDRRPRAAVLVAGGVAIRQRFYQGFAEALSAAGIAAMTIDYRGIGESAGGHPSPTISGWVVDIDTALDHLHDRFDGPVFYVGHSFGGQALGLVSDPTSRVAGAVLIAAQSGYIGHWPWPDRLWLGALMYAALPLAATAGRVPGWLGVGSGLPPGAAREWAAWCRRPGFTTEALPHSRLTYGLYRKEMLALSFPDDVFAPRPAVEALLGFFVNADIEHRVVAPAYIGQKQIGHFSFFRRSHAALWAPVVEWLARRAPAGEITAGAPVRPIAAAGSVHEVTAPHSDPRGPDTQPSHRAAA